MMSGPVSKCKCKVLIDIYWEISTFFFYISLILMAAVSKRIEECICMDLIAHPSCSKRHNDLCNHERTHDAFAIEVNRRGGSASSYMELYTSESCNLTRVYRLLSTLIYANHNILD